MALQLRCPKCRKAFPWSGNDFPECCQLCNETIGGNRDDDDIVMPFIRSAKTTNNDKLYRQMEAGAETRMHIAAQQTGAPVSEMSAMKMTDMHDNQREGDIAAKLLPDPGLGQHFKSNGSEFMAGNATGAVVVNGQNVGNVMPRAGATAIGNFRNATGQGPCNVATVSK